MGLGGIGICMLFRESSRQIFQLDAARRQLFRRGRQVSVVHPAMRISDSATWSPTVHS